MKLASIVFLIITLAAYEISASEIVEHRPISYPYVASVERSERIKNSYEKIQAGMTPEQVKQLIGEPDQTRPMWDRNIFKAKQVGYFHWFIIQRKSDKGSQNDRGEKLVQVSYDLNWRVFRVDHWGFDERKR